MGVLPLQFMPGENRESHGLTGREEFAIEGVASGSASEVTVRADGTVFRATVRLDTPRERTFFQHGGILPHVVRSRLTT
jgi:aconitate hydratase